MKKSEIVAKFLKQHPGYLKKNPYLLQEAIVRHLNINVNSQVCRKVQMDLRRLNKLEVNPQIKPFKRLFYDIEVSPNIGFFWNAGYKLNIGPDNIIEEKKIICVSYKWENDNRVYNIKWSDDKDDKQLLIEFTKVLNEATEIIGHNGDNFDLPWLRGRALYHQIPFPAHVKTLDTLLKARSSFRLNSNRLDYLAKYLRVGGKIADGGFESWKRITLYNDQEALNQMIEYCNNDVVILEDVYHKMKNYIKANTHEGVAKGNYKWTCPLTGSTNVRLLQNNFTANGSVQRIMICEDNQHVYKISNSDYLHFLLAK
jgi:hypothetical protein